MNQLLTSVVFISLTLTLWVNNFTPVVANAAGENRTQQPQRGRSTNYEQFMQAGYTATERRDYQTALINFRRALRSRPNDPYARAAISNVQGYIQQIQAAEARARQIQSLDQQLQQASSSQDWICAAAVVERLIQLYPENSFQRAELVVYRGQLQGFINAGTNINSWSTVCSSARVSPQTQAS